MSKETYHAGAKSEISSIRSPRDRRIPLQENKIEIDRLAADLDYLHKTKNQKS